MCSRLTKGIMLDWSHPITVGFIVTSYAAILGGVIKLSRAVSDLRGILTGPDGTNGVRGDIRELVSDRKTELAIQRKQREEDVALRASMETRMARLEDDHRTLAKRIASLEHHRGATYTPRPTQL